MASKIGDDPAFPNAQLGYWGINLLYPNSVYMAYVVTAGKYGEFCAAAEAVHDWPASNKVESVQ